MGPLWSQFLVIFHHILEFLKSCSLPFHQIGNLMKPSSTPYVTKFGTFSSSSGPFVTKLGTILIKFCTLWSKLNLFIKFGSFMRYFLVIFHHILEFLKSSSVPLHQIGNLMLSSWKIFIKFGFLCIRVLDLFIEFRTFSLSSGTYVTTFGTLFSQVWDSYVAEFGTFFNKLGTLCNQLRHLV